MFPSAKRSFLLEKVINLAENVMSDVTKLPLHFCKFHRELTVSSVTAMTLRLDVPKDNTKHMF